MRGGVRLFVLLAAALSLAAANHSDAKSGGKQAAAESAVSNSLQNIATSYDQSSKRAESTEKDEAKCGPEKYGSNTDLCAQWKAADAATDSAWWAWASAILGLGSFMGVVVALGIALHSNLIARDTARHQLRAYITLDSVELTPPEIMRGPFSFQLFWRNSGQTPASRVFTRTVFDMLAGKPVSLDYSVVDKADAIGPFVVGPGQTIASERIEVSFEDGMRILHKTGSGMVLGRVSYEDVFADRQRETEFCVELRIEGQPKLDKAAFIPFGDFNRMSERGLPKK